MDYEDEMVCEFCGEQNWEYIGEAYDDGQHMGSDYRCKECGHQQCDDNDGWSDFIDYDDWGYDYNQI